MLVVDAHLDLAWNALQWNRNLLYSAYTTRVRENRTPGPGRAQGTVALPEMRRGRVALCCATLLARSTGNAVPHLDYPSPLQSYAAAQGQLAYYRVLQRQGYVRLITTLAQLEHHIREWEAWEAALDDDSVYPASAPGEIKWRDITPPLGFIISMESADPIIDPAYLLRWWDAGLRVVGPAHYGLGRYAGGTGTEEGLTALGEALLPAMAQVGMILDMSHFSDQAFWQALDVYDGPVLASHNNCRALVPHQRQFSDAQLQAIMARDGVIGVAFDAWMLQPEWVTGGSTNEDVALADVVDHIDHICQLAGNSRHAAIGSDLDGGFGREQSPRDLDTIADLQKIPALLEARGYEAEDIAAIMHGNWLRLLRERWAA